MRKWVLFGFKFSLLNMRPAWPEYGLWLHLWISQTSSNELAKRQKLLWRLRLLILVEDLAYKRLHLWCEDK